MCRCTKQEHWAHSLATKHTSSKHTVYIQGTNQWIQFVGTALQNWTQWVATEHSPTEHTVWVQNTRALNTSCRCKTHKHTTHRELVDTIQINKQTNTKHIVQTKTHNLTPSYPIAAHQYATICWVLCAHVISLLLRAVNSTSHVYSVCNISRGILQSTW
jgi:hypothetical protein